MPFYFPCFFLIVFVFRAFVLPVFYALFALRAIPASPPAYRQAGGQAGGRQAPSTRGNNLFGKLADCVFLFMLIGGLQKTSLLDYPDKVSAIIFTIGCNFRCGFCYNSHLVTAVKRAKIITEDEVFKFLKARKKILDAVVLTGGEPTRQKDLPDFIDKVKELGYLVKLDTNGTNPKMLKKLIKNKLVDYLAMDIKGPLPKYAKIANVSVSLLNIKKSIRLIMDSGLPYEFRSTILPALHNRQDLIAMAELISGARKYFLQKFMTGDNLNNREFKKLPSFTNKEMKELAKSCSAEVKLCSVR